ncbi:MAG: DegT/DnrJ/EryC1/StrS family aminotransferase [Armatimonadetes bacterium]|nr:DegT/DnrJ/EryC1/StrS family aminotransferase [Armatimonadota bacterium]
MDWRVPLSDIDYGPEEEEAVLKVLRSKWLTMGSVTQQFENQFADLVGTKHAIAVSNGTQALHLACVALGVGPGDEVIVPSLTFVATANAALYTGAEVRFAEVVSSQDLTISPRSIEEQITTRTKALIVVHYGGHPCQMGTIMDIASRRGLAVIEDAAHAPGASLNGKPLGSHGDVGCFSFFSNKNLCTGEGGMVVTDREDLAEKARLCRSHGMTSLTWDRHKGHAYSYDVAALGYNYRIDEMRSALGLAQLRKLAGSNARRKAITETYRERLEDTDLEIPFNPPVGEPAYHIFPVLLPRGADRRQFIDRMRASGVQTSIHYPPIHQFEYHGARYTGVSLPTTEDVAAREVTLPLYPTMSEADVETVVSAVLGAL